MDQLKDNEMNTSKTIEHIVGWLESHCEKSGLKGFVVGVSGGIDSAVTSTLCAKTKRPVMALNMPIYQEKGQEDRSGKHINWLEKKFPNVKGVKTDLTPIFQSIENTFPDEIQDDLSMANTRSRLRMVTLYAFSSHYRMLVAGTGNKVEDFGVGFYTKYGDGGVDLSPIADLMKSEVYAMAGELGIIEEILTAPPTDGLWNDNRTDESQIGATYDELEWAMAFIEKKGDEKPLTERQQSVLKIYRRFHNTNKHKMTPIPICCIPEALKSE